MADEIQSIYQIDGHFFKLIDITFISEAFNDEDGKYYLSVFVSHIPTPIVISFNDTDIDHRKRENFIDAWLITSNYELFGDFDNG